MGRDYGGAPKLGCTKETLRRWVREAEPESGPRPGPTRAEEDSGQGARARESRAAANHRDLLPGIRIFRTGGSRPRSVVMYTFIAAYREAFGVEPICRILEIAASGYSVRRARQAGPRGRPTRRATSSFGRRWACVAAEPRGVHNQTLCTGPSESRPVTHRVVVDCPAWGVPLTESDRMACTASAVPTDAAMASFLTAEPICA